MEPFDRIYFELWPGPLLMAMRHIVEGAERRQGANFRVAISAVNRGKTSHNELKLKEFFTKFWPRLVA
jgi:hypothetical protein